jgi:transposase
MDGRVLGIERRRRWSRDEKARIVEETLIPGAVVSEVARRHGVAQSLLFTWRRLARTTEPARRDGSILLPVEIDATAPPPSEATRASRPATSGRRMRSGVIEIELGSGNRVRVDNDVDADALRRVLGVLSER